jgi:hypothetical protein
MAVWQIKIVEREAKIVERGAKIVEREAKKTSEGTCNGITRSVEAG